MVRDGDHHHQDQYAGRVSESVTRHHAYDSTGDVVDYAGVSSRALRGPGGLIHPVRVPRGAAATGVCDGRIVQETAAWPAKT